MGPFLQYAGCTFTVVAAGWTMLVDVADPVAVVETVMSTSLTTVRVCELVAVVVTVETEVCVTAGRVE